MLVILPPVQPVPIYAHYPELFTGMGCWGGYNDEQRRLCVWNGEISCCRHIGGCVYAAVGKMYNFQAINRCPTHELSNGRGC